MEQKELEQVCKNVRRDIINMTADASSGHPGGVPVGGRNYDSIVF